MVKVAAGSNQWRTREAFTTVNEADYLYGFSVTSITGTQYFYDFILETDGSITAQLFDSEYTALGTESIGQLIDRSAPVSHAINYGQVVINSAGWSTPVWCYIGSTPIPAQKVESINPDTPALDLFTGQVCSFADRFVWSYRNQIIINDPGTEPRTITSPNSISFSGDICDIFQQGGTGSLIVITTVATYTLPPDGLAGFKYDGIISKSTHYQGVKPRNAGTARGQVHGLVRSGLMNLESGEIIQLTTYRHPRRITKPVGPGFGGDYRSGELFAFDSGYMISFGRGAPFCVVDLDGAGISWWDDDNMTMPIVSVTSTADGRLFLYTIDTAALVWGDDPNCTFGLATEFPTPGVLSNVVREMIVTATGDNTTTVESYVRNSLQSSVVPGIPGSVIESTSVWGSTAVLTELEPRSRRHQRAIRTDGIYLEVGVTRDQVIENVQIGIDGQARKRPTN